MAYAKTTKVPVERTMGEIQKLLNKAKARGTSFASMGPHAFVAFVVGDTGVKMKIKILEVKPGMNAATIKTAEQVNRTKWRCLLLCIKAKVESVESGVETFEQAFLPHIVLQDGTLVGEKIIPKINELNNTQPALLLGI